jgi:putative acetyltransferase
MDTAYYTKLLVTEVTGEDHPRLLAIWESAVSATHDFLQAGDFAFYQSRLPQYLARLDVYACKNERQEILGFLGMSGRKIEMLFIDGALRGKGIGKKLLAFAVHRLNADQVDVNEQNRQALGFYHHLGFSVAGRSRADGEGKNYPLLHLKRDTSPENT